MEIIIYNIMCSMHKIVESFDREKGQIHEVERCNLIIQMVIDWSFSAGFLFNKYYKHFCNWGKHLNIDDT
jgi:hypothetical protein